MLAYTMVGTKDLARALRFYTPLFNAMGLDIASHLVTRTMSTCPNTS